MNKYYVYGHYSVENDKLFYIGKGSGKRLKSTTSRSKTWYEYTSKNKWYAKIIHDNLSSEESLKLEKELILANDVLNISLRNTTKPITTEDLSWFEYSDQSPTCLIWKKDVIGVNGRIYQARGSVAGIKTHTSDKKDYRYAVNLGGNKLYVHRIVYALFNEISQDKVIDHIDGNALNNRIENLREVTQYINSKNTSRKIKSNTNFTGVSRVQRKHLKFAQFIAYYKDLDGNHVSKEFSNYKMSEEEALRLAKEWRSTQIALLNDQGAGYTSRHGQ